MNGSKRRHYNAEFKRNTVSLAGKPDRSAQNVKQSLGIANRIRERASAARH